MIAPISYSAYETTVPSGEDVEMILDDLKKHKSHLDSHNVTGYVNVVDEDFYTYPIMSKPVFYLDVDGLKVEKVRNTEVSFHPSASFKNRPLPEVPPSLNLKLPSRRRKSVFTNSRTAWFLCLIVLVVLVCGVVEVAFSVVCVNHSTESTSSEVAVKNKSRNAKEALTTVNVTSSRTTTPGIVKVTPKLSTKTVKKCTKKRQAKTTMDSTTRPPTAVTSPIEPTVDNVPEYILLKVRPKTIDRIYGGWIVEL